MIQTAASEHKTRVVILGGGFGGVYTARRLERVLRRRPDVEVVLVSQDNYFVMTPLLFDVATGTLGLHNCSVPIRSVLRSTQFVEAAARDIDLDRRTVTVAASGVEHEIGYDQLVLALGAVTNERAIPGSGRALTFKTLADAAVLRDHVLERFERADVELDPDRKRRQLTFAVIGGGFVGVELFGELTAVVRSILPLYRRVRDNELRFVLFQYGNRIMPELDAPLAEYSTRVLCGRPGVDIRTGVGVRRIEPGRVVFDGGVLEAETIVLAAGTVPNPLVSGLPLPKDRRGRLVVGPTMRCHDRPEVWGIGDCAAIPDRNGNPYPSLAQHAIRQAKVLARNIEATLSGGEPKPFVYDTLGIMATLGAGKAVGKMLSFRLRGRLAWWARRAYYLMTMPGWGRRLRILADWGFATLFRPDVGKIDFAREAAHYLREMPPETPADAVPETAAFAALETASPVGTPP